MLLFILGQRRDVSFRFKNITFESVFRLRDARAECPSLIIVQLQRVAKTWASLITSKQYCASHSYRTVRLNRSAYAFCCGFPGWIYSIRIVRRLAQFTIDSLMYSGVLSQRRTFGVPRHCMICSSDRITCQRAGKSRLRCRGPRGWNRQ